MDFSGKRVAVLDTIHGGTVLCHKLQQIGVDADAIDIYKHSPAPATIDAYDIVVAPIHAYSPLITRASENGTPVISHHAVVGHLAQQSRLLRNALVFEITGVRGKTTTAALLQQAFNDRPLLSLTSRSLEARDGDTYVAQKRVSITPASVLVALDLLEEHDISPEVCIFETSLGGTGIGDVNILTTLAPAYTIAQGTRTSTDAKLQMVSNAKADSCLIAPSTLVERAPLTCVNSIGDHHATVCCELAENSTVNISFTALKRLSGDQISGELSFTPTGCYDLAAYRTSFLCFTAAALTAGVEVPHIEHILTSFKGVKGRVSARVAKQRILIDNSNSGLDADAITRAIAFGLTFKKPGHKAVLIIGEEAKNICSGIRSSAITSAARNKSFEDVVLVGEQTRVSRAHVKHCSDLKSALNTAVGLTSARDVIVSCVKTWR